MFSGKRPAPLRPAAAEKEKTTEPHECETGGFRDQLNLNGKSVGPRQAAKRAAVKRSAHGGSIIKVAAVRVVGLPETGVGQDAVLHTRLAGILDSRRDRRSPERNGERVVGTAERYPVLDSGLGVNGGTRGKHGVITRAVDPRDEWEDWLGNTGDRGIRSGVIGPACGPVNTRSKDHGICDVDVLAHLVRRAISSRGVLSSVVEIGAKSNGDCAGCADCGEGRAKGDKGSRRHVGR